MAKENDSEYLKKNPLLVHKLSKMTEYRRYFDRFSIRVC